MVQQSDSSETPASAGGSPMRPPVRTMADITRLFMAGAGQPGAQRPRRTPPKSSSAPTPTTTPSTSTPHTTVPSTPSTPAAPIMAATTAPVSRVHPAVTEPSISERPTRRSATDFPADTPVSAFAPAAPVAAGAAPEPAIPAQSAGLPALQAALAGQFGPEALTSVLEAAKLLAGQHHVAIGVIGQEEGALRVARVEGGERPVFTRTDFVNPRAPLDVQLARALYTLRDAIRHWIVVVPPEGAAARQVLAAADDWLLPTGTSNDDLIACYRALKSVCTLTGAEKAGRKIRLLVRTGDRGEAARIHARLDRVTRGFLGQELLLVALDRPAFAIVQQLAEWPLGQEAEAAWLSVADFATETAHPVDEDEIDEPADEDVAPAQHEFSGARAAEEAAIHSVLDAEERAALNIGLGDPVEPALGTSCVPTTLVEETPLARPTAQPERAVTRPAPAMPQANPLAVPLAAVIPHAAPAPTTSHAVSAVHAVPAAVTPPAGWTPGLPAARPMPAATRSTPCLRAVEVPAAGGITPAQRWEAVRQAVGDLVPGAVTLEARPPEADYALLAADAAGRLHLWTLAEQDATGWSALWQWAQAHRQIVALTRRDLPIDAAADVAVHVVLPEGGRAGAAPAGVKWYRVYPVRCGEKTAAVVTPVG